MPHQVEEASRSEPHRDILKKVGTQWRVAVRRQRQGVLPSYFVHQMVQDQVSPSSCTSCRAPSATIATHWLLIASTLRFRCGEGRHCSVVFRSLKDERRSSLAASCERSLSRCCPTSSENVSQIIDNEMDDPAIPRKIVQVSTQHRKVNPCSSSDQILCGGLSCYVCDSGRSQHSKCVKT